MPHRSNPRSPPAMPRVLNVGQCVPDHMSISSYLRRQFAADVEKVDDHAAAVEAAKGGGVDLVLVNRLYDADGSPGLLTVKAIAEAGGPPVMLVSNYAEAQQDAVAAGAKPGFGKGDLGTAAAKEKLESVLGGD